MKDIVDKLIESLDHGNILLAVVIVAIALVFYYKKIIELVEFMEERKKARITKLTEALSCKFITGVTKSHLEEELATEQFKIITGVRLEKEIREAVIQAHKNTQGELAFIHFKRALPHLFYENKVLNVKISNFELLYCWLNGIFAFILTVIGLALMMWFPTQFKDVRFIQVISLYGLGLFLNTISLFMFSQVFPVLSANKIKKYFEATDKSSNTSEN